MEPAAYVQIPAVPLTSRASWRSIGPLCPRELLGAVRAASAPACAVVGEKPFTEACAEHP